MPSNVIPSIIPIVFVAVEVENGTLSQVDDAKAYGSVLVGGWPDAFKGLKYAQFVYMLLFGTPSALPTAYQI